ncbi:MAG: DUF5411 family protein [Bacilli bacterium]
MKESFWGIFIVMLGVVSVSFIYFFQTASSLDEQNYTLLKEITEASMYDAIDLAAYRRDGTVRIDREKFVENFIRRFAESVTLGNTYVIKIYDVNETPPKVSLSVSSKLNANVTDEVVEFDIVNRLDAILETPY